MLGLVAHSCDPAAGRQEQRMVWGLLGLLSPFLFSNGGIMAAHWFMYFMLDTTKSFGQGARVWIPEEEKFRQTLISLYCLMYRKLVTKAYRINHAEIPEANASMSLQLMDRTPWLWVWFPVTVKHVIGTQGRYCSLSRTNG